MLCAGGIDKMYEGVVSLVLNDCSDDLDHGCYPGPTGQHANVSVLCVWGGVCVCTVCVGGGVCTVCVCVGGCVCLYCVCLYCVCVCVIQKLVSSSLHIYLHGQPKMMIN